MEDLATTRTRSCLYSQILPLTLACDRNPVADHLGPSLPPYSSKVSESRRKIYRPSCGASRHFVSRQNWGTIAIKGRVREPRHTHSKFSTPSFPRFQISP